MYGTRIRVFRQKLRADRPFRTTEGQQPDEGHMTTIVYPQTYTLENQGTA